jgi:hypothetical protein
MLCDLMRSRMRHRHILCAKLSILGIFMGCRTLTLSTWNLLLKLGLLPRMDHPWYTLSFAGRFCSSFQEIFLDITNKYLPQWGKSHVHILGWRHTLPWTNMPFYDAIPWCERQPIWWRHDGRIKVYIDLCNHGRGFLSSFTETILKIFFST